MFHRELSDLVCTFRKEHEENPENEDELHRQIQERVCAFAETNVPALVEELLALLQPLIPKEGWQDERPEPDYPNNHQPGERPMESAEAIRSPDPRPACVHSTDFGGTLPQRNQADGEQLSQTLGSLSGAAGTASDERRRSPYPWRIGRR